MKAMIRFRGLSVSSFLLLLCLFPKDEVSSTKDFRVGTRSENYLTTEDISASEDNTLHRLRGLYNHLREHPVLFDSRLVLASRPPALSADDEDVGPPLVPSSWYSTTPVDSAQMTERVSRGKRKLELPLTEACPSVTEWITFNKSRDIHDNEVEIFQPSANEEESRLGAQVRSKRQFFYSTRCAYDVEDHPCSGISFMYRSKCLTKRGYVMALIRRSPADQFDWDWIQVPISCNCGVSKISLL